MNNNWISVKERLPEKPGKYLVTCRWGKNDAWHVDDLEYDFEINAFSRLEREDMIFENGGAFGELFPYVDEDGNEEPGRWALDNLYEVSAWMPYPEPYKENV